MRLPRSKALSVGAAVVALLSVTAVTMSASEHKVQDSGQRNSRGTRQQGRAQVQALEAGSRSRWISLSGQIGSGQKGSAQTTLAQEQLSAHVVTMTRRIPFQTVRRRTDQLYEGQARVLTNGVEGLLQIQSSRVYQSGHLVSSRVVKSVLRHPVERVIEIGTKVHPKVNTHLVSESVPLSGRSSVGGMVALKQLTVVATAYVAGGRTAIGVPAVPGVIAVDPRVIPLGTKVYIPGIGVVHADDTGGAIIGDRIDICMATLAEADAWGVRTITIYEIK